MVWNGIVFVSTVGYSPFGRGAIYALDAATGAVRWKFVTIADPWRYPLEAGGGGLWYPVSVDTLGRLYAGNSNPSPWGGTPQRPNGGAFPARPVHGLADRARRPYRRAALVRPGHPASYPVPFSTLSGQRQRIDEGRRAECQPLTVDSVSVWGVGDTMAHARTDRFHQIFALGRSAVRFDQPALPDRSSPTLESDSRMSLTRRRSPASHQARARQCNRPRPAWISACSSIRCDASLTRKLNRPLAPGVTVSGAITDIRIVALATSSTAFVLRVILDGGAKLDIR